VKYNGRAIDFRVSIMPSIHGEDAVLRVLDKESMSEKFRTLTLDVVGFDEDDLRKFRRYIKEPYGMVLVTGPTGSGKTTTLYSILKHLSKPEVNIVTVEDPIEMVFEDFNQVAVRPQIDITFASALRTVLRQDPDIIMVGEVRDQETAQIAIQAALTGHLVLSTLHTNDAPGAITRLLDMGIEPYLVASALERVAAQRLVRVLCPKCKEPDRYGGDEVRARLGAQAPAGTHYLGRGCEFCNYTGYRGRVAIFEIAEMDDELRHLVINRAPHHTLKEQAQRAGMATLLVDGLEKAAAGLTSLAEVWRVVSVERANGTNGPDDAVERSGRRAVVEDHEPGR